MAQQQPAAPGAPPQPSILAAFLPFIVMLVAFYFLLMRPQQQQQRKRQEMLASLRKGNHVITLGGIYGEIVEVRDDSLSLKIADKVVVKLAKSGVSSVLGKDNEK